MPKISILVPVWIDIPDKIVWFMEALNSIRMQTFQDWEVIIVDDYSPLELSEPKWNYQDEPRFRWFRASSNQGPSLCRNTAVGLSESEALLPLDADDMLAHESVLADMYTAWEQDKSRIIYGDLQRLVVKGTSFEREKKFVLGQYAFSEAMKLGGIMPVTTLHSQACHQKAGGWKPELEAGLEDVEYIIAAGKAGFCGHKISSMVLLYRQHDESRAYKLRHGILGDDKEPREGEMRNLIIEMHADIYRGDFPVGCCDQSPSATTNYIKNNPVRQGIITTLDEYSSSDKVWIEYVGSKKAGFKVFGQKTRASYYVNGTGHRFEVHKDDFSLFDRMDRKSSFNKITDPNREPELAPEPVPVSQNTFNPPSPPLATIERYDRVAANSRGLDLPAAPAQETIIMQPTTLVSEQIGLQPPVSPQPVQMDEQVSLQPPIDPSPPIENKQEISIVDLGLGNVGDILLIEGWTVERLASASLDGPDGLRAIKGVGEKRANQIIEKAKALLETI